MLRYQVVGETNTTSHAIADPRDGIAEELAAQGVPATLHKLANTAPHLIFTAKRGDEVHTWTHPDPRRQMLETMQRVLGENGWQVEFTEPLEGELEN